MATRADLRAEASKDSENQEGNASRRSRREPQARAGSTALLADPASVRS